MEHRVKTISRTPRCRVDRCSCGAVHVTAGSTTVRVEEGLARELRDALVLALSEMDRQLVQAPTSNPGRVTDDDEDPTLH